MTKSKAKKAPVKAKTYTVEDGTFVLREPLPKAEIKIPKEGSKRHIIMSALVKGATIKQIMDMSGWAESAARSFMGYDVAKCGLGVKRVTKGGASTYFLIVPKGVSL